MKEILIVLLYLAILDSCTPRQPVDSKSSLTQAQDESPVPDIKAIDAKYPLSLKDINLHDSSNMVALNESITSQIQQTIIDYYFNECAGDESESNFKVKDTYIGTIRLPDSQETIFMVLLNHIPSGQLTSKILFYDNTTQSFEGKTLDFNIHALYDFENGKLTPSNLKTDLNITTPEIELVDFDKDGHNEFKFTRLYHNGTSNAIEAMILTIKNAQVDILDIRQIKL